MSRIQARGPYFDELAAGQRFEQAPGVTLTAGAAAVHQSIVGDRLRVVTDHDLGRAVTGGGEPVHPALVWDIAIGQSTVATHFVRANLFYRGLVFHRFPCLGDTLYTTTEVVGLKQNSTRPGRPRTGLAALHILTRDQEGRTVLDFYRCAMLPLGPGAPDTGFADDLSGIGGRPAEPERALREWELSALPVGETPLEAGDVIEVVGGDVVTSAPELARLTLNVAQVHHDARAGQGRRLVYGGHTIGIAAAQVTRALPDVVTFLTWQSCDHTGPVYEGDTLRSTITVESTAPYEAGLRLVHLRSVVEADPFPGEESTSSRPVLDWRFTVLM